MEQRVLPRAASAPLLRSYQYETSQDRVPLEGPRLGNRQVSSMWNRVGEPKVIVPTYDGTVEWKIFWVQFRLIASRFNWSEFNTLDRLVVSLREKAIEFYANLPSEVQLDLRLLIDAFSRRFDDNGLPEIHRRNLRLMRQDKKEKLAGYAERVRKMTNKAYPGIYGTEVLEKMTIENLLNGLEDQTVAYEVMVKKPKSVYEAVDMVQLHLACKPLI